MRDRHATYAGRPVQMESDALTREIAVAAAQVAQLKVLIDEQSDGASDEWVAAAHRALRIAQQQLGDLHGADDRADRAVDHPNQTAS